MKIEGKNTSVNLEAYVKNIADKKQRGKSTKNASTIDTHEDKVVLSPKAKEIKAAKKALDSIPDIQDKKVAQIQKQIEGGTYRVEGKKIAVKIIKESLLNELL